MGEHSIFSGEGTGILLDRLIVSWHVAQGRAMTKVSDLGDTLQTLMALRLRGRGTDRPRVHI